MRNDYSRFRRLIDEGSLWIMVAAPSVWAAHFLLCYWVVAVWCAKDGGALGPVMPWLWGLTALCLAIIAFLVCKALRGYGGKLVEAGTLTEDTEDHRKRFLGHATLLLCALSAVAILFDVVPLLVFGQCRGW